MSSKQKLTTKDFITRAKVLHGSRYDYSGVNYQNMNTPVIIECAEHGVFEQLPRVHLRGSGCPACANSEKVAPATPFGGEVMARDDETAVSHPSYPSANNGKFNIFAPLDWLLVSLGLGFMAPATDTKPDDVDAIVEGADNSVVAATPSQPDQRNLLKLYSRPDTAVTDTRASEQPRDSLRLPVFLRGGDANPDTQQRATKGKSKSSSKGVPTLDVYVLTKLKEGFEAVGVVDTPLIDFFLRIAK